MNKKFTKAEVLNHNSLEDCWIIVRNKVYDLTPFLMAHPGGADLLLSRAGEDATSYFMMRHGNQAKVERMLQSLYIGELCTEDQIDQSVYKESFVLELMDQVREKGLFKVSRKLRNKFAFIRLSLIAVFFTCSLVALYVSTSYWFAIPLIVCQSLIGVSLFGLIAHESTHQHFPKSPVLKYLLKISWPIFWPFISQKPLVYEHNSHHVKIGDKDYDFEVAGFAKLIRYSSSVEWTPWHKYQHKLAKFLYPFYANIITTFGGNQARFWKLHNRKVALVHVVSILGTLGFYIVLPSILVGFSYKWILFYLIYQGVLFTGIYLGAAINHFIPASLERIPEGKENLYGYYICHHTSNFGSTNPFWFWLTGGFNIQVEHHLSPFVPVENLRELIPLVRELCEKHNYPYHEFSGFSALWGAHYDFLERLSSKEVIEEELYNKSSYQAR